MLCGQLAMIFSPLAMSHFSLVKDTLPWFITTLSGVFVILCMVFIISTPGGLSAGRASAETLEMKAKEKSSTGVVVVVEKQEKESPSTEVVPTVDVEKQSSASAEGVSVANVEKQESLSAEAIAPVDVEKQESVSVDKVSADNSEKQEISASAVQVSSNGDTQ